jgi:hypothetical protein
MSTHKDDHDSDATTKRDNLFGKELVYGILAIVVLGVLYIMISNYLDRRAHGAAQREYNPAQRARDAAKQVCYKAQRERVTVSTYEPSQFHQNECVICLQDFANTQTYHTLSCGYILCEECISQVLLNYDKCLICRVKILN